MRIKINDQLSVQPVVTRTTICPAGTAYWHIDYVVDGICIYTVTTGAISGQPSPITYLDYDHERWMPCEGEGWVRRTKTHREWLTDAAKQIEVTP